MSKIMINKQDEFLSTSNGSTYRVLANHGSGCWSCESSEDWDDDGNVTRWEHCYLTTAEVEKLVGGRFCLSSRISLDNGHTYKTAAEAMPEITKRGLWDAVVAMMDDDIREAVADDLYSDDQADFLAEYLERSADDLVIG